MNEDECIFLTEKIAKGLKEELEKIKRERKKEKEVREIEFSPDLGKSRRKFLIEEIEEIPLEKVKGNFIYCWNKKEQELYKLAIFDKHFYKLEIGKDGVPYLVIDGFRMHLISISPLAYANRVVRKLTPKGKVLDCFAGLGYISIELTKRKEVERVVAIEKNKAVIELAKINPYSKEFFANKKIELKEGDCWEILSKNKEEFDYIVCDPPSFRYKESRHFYSRKFLAFLLKSLKKEGKLYFYTGRIAKEIMEKFFNEKGLVYEWDEKLLGFFVKRKNSRN